MFPKLFPKDPSQFSDVFLLAACSGAFEPVYYPTLVGSSVLVHGGYQKGVDGLLPLK